VQSFEIALRSLMHRQIVVWLNHPDLKSLSGLITRVYEEHFELSNDQSTYYIPYVSVVAVRPS
jgi:hypothetical protein